MNRITQAKQQKLFARAASEARRYRNAKPCSRLELARELVKARKLNPRITKTALIEVVALKYNVPKALVTKAFNDCLDMGMDVCRSLDRIETDVKARQAQIRRLNEL